MSQGPPSGSLSVVVNSSGCDGSERFSARSTAVTRTVYLVVGVSPEITAVSSLTRSGCAPPYATS